MDPTLKPATSGSEGSQSARDDFREDSTAVAALRDTAKWIAGGVAVATVGIIAGSSLTGLGSLGLEPRLLLACCALFLGFTALAALLWVAIDVLTPRAYEINAILRGEIIASPDLDPILDRAQKTLLPGMPPIRKLLLEYERAVELDDIDIANKWSNQLGKALSYIRYDHSRILFLRLKERLFYLAPVIALCFLIFAWAANPSKESAWDVAPYQKMVDISPDERPVLGKLLTSPDCLTSNMTVVVLREHRSGSQDVVTIPTTGCAPVRLRLDHGRLAPISQTL